MPGRRRIMRAPHLTRFAKSEFASNRPPSASKTRQIGFCSTLCDLKRSRKDHPPAERNYSGFCVRQAAIGSLLSSVHRLWCRSSAQLVYPCILNSKQEWVLGVCSRARNMVSRVDTRVPCDRSSSPRWETGPQSPLTFFEPCKVESQLATAKPFESDTARERVPAL
jgi:hypothetical protein